MEIKSRITEMKGKERTIAEELGKVILLEQGFVPIGIFDDNNVKN